LTAPVVDLGRVREALARLDRVAGEHPELATPEARDRLGAWIEAGEEEEEAEAGQQAGEQAK
jgi:hypothetical protein